MNKDMQALRDKDDSVLRQQVKDQKRRLFDLRSQAVTEKLENPSQFRVARREIARINTVLRQREIEAAKSAAAK